MLGKVMRLLAAIVVLLFALCCSAGANAAKPVIEASYPPNHTDNLLSIEGGYVEGFHILSKNVNDKHPFARLGIGFLDLHYFRNSMSKDSYSASLRADLAENFALNIGFTSGYNRHNVPGNLFIGNYMFMVGLTYTRKIVDHVYVKSIILGDSVNFGVSIGF